MGIFDKLFNLGKKSAYVKPSSQVGGDFLNAVNLTPNLEEYLISTGRYYNQLAKNPSYVVRPDLGGFGLAYLDKPTYKKYISQYNENLDPNDPNIYAVGTHNKPMTDFTIK